MTKNITIIGTGYVGLVTGVCLADLGNLVTCVDIDEAKLNSLKNSQVPFFEPGLSELITKNRNNLSFTSDLRDAVKNSEIIFIAVGTPQKETGECDLSFVEDVAKELSKFNLSGKIVVVKSTVPVGTGAKVEKILKGQTPVLSNPEFLKEGSAINDFKYPERVVIGAKKLEEAKVLELIYLPLRAKIVITNRESSELIKYASNAFLATKISFINSLANLAEKVGANIKDVSLGMGLDSRIGVQFLKAGLGYGGSCFPKDVKALIHTANGAGEELKILNAVEEVNNSQKTIPVKKLKSKIKIKDSKIAILGLSFKPNTDDIREAPSLEIICKAASRE